MIRTICSATGILLTTTLFAQGIGADGLHCDSDSVTMASQMQDFLRFAREARDRKKVFLLTHSSIQTDGYKNTTSTADYLINNIGATRQPFSAVDEIGVPYSSCDTGYFHLKGYIGHGKRSLEASIRNVPNAF